jgi:hypothetical protein
MLSTGHRFATLSAPAAGFSALSQLSIPTSRELFAAPGTLRASFSTNATDIGVHTGSSKHKIGGRETEFGAILQQADMIGFGIPAGLFQAILNGGGADGVTTSAFVNTGLEVCVRQHAVASAF